MSNRNYKLRIYYQKRKKNPFIVSTYFPSSELQNICEIETVKVLSSYVRIKTTKLLAIKI